MVQNVDQMLCPNLEAIFKYNLNDFRAPDDLPNGVQIVQKPSIAPPGGPPGPLELSKRPPRTLQEAPKRPLEAHGGTF